MKGSFVIGLQSLLDGIRVIIIIQIDTSVINQDIHSSLFLLDLLGQSRDITGRGDIQLGVLDVPLQTEIFTSSRTGV
jgi:hypothetical protein